MGRTSDIHIHAHPELEKIITSQIKFFCEGLPFEIHFHNFSPFKVETIYDDRSITVKTIPLKHRVPCCGFLFEEKESQPHINRKMIDAFNIPVTMIKDIKNGGNYTLPDGTVIDNKQLTLPPTPGKRYAYCSDTAYNEKIIPIIQGVDALYHEATFLHDDTIRIKETLHSSALQAATIAQKAEVKQLIIGHYSARHNNINHFLKEAKTIFPNTYAATDGTTYQF